MYENAYKSVCCKFFRRRLACDYGTERRLWVRGAACDYGAGRCRVEGACDYGKERRGYDYGAEWREGGGVTRLLSNFAQP